MEHGLAKLVGTDERRLFDEMQTLLDDQQAYRQMSRVENPYGDGFASRRIIVQLVGEEARRFASSPVRGCEPGEA